MWYLKVTRNIAFGLIAFFSIPSQAQENRSVFSPLNRYHLSYELLSNIKSAIIDSSVFPWLSVPQISTLQNNAITFSAGKQTIGVDFGAIAALEHAGVNDRFGALAATIVYNSPILNAYVTGDVYSTERNIVDNRQDIEYERFIKKDFNEPITGLFDFRFNLPEAYLESSFKFLTLSIGKKKLRWGPGYKGTLGLSGTAYSPFYYYHLNLLFGNMLNMSAFLCGYDDESFYQKELQSTEKLIVKSNKVELKSFLPRYGAGQRLDIRFGKHFQLGFYELVDFFGSNELTRFANPLQIYYLANEASGTNNANLLGGMDFNLIFNRLRFYGEFLNDDITVMEDAGNPNKYAYQLGGAFYGRDPLIQTGIEYTHVAQYVYSHSRVLSRHAHWGESMGWPWGNYQDVFTAYAVCQFPHSINSRIEANVWIKGDGALEDDWYADSVPDLDHVPYLPENATTTFSAILSAQYTPFSWLTYCAYYEPVVTNKTVQHGFYTYLRLGLPGKRVFKVK